MIFSLLKAIVALRSMYSSRKAVRGVLTTGGCDFVIISVHNVRCTSLISWKTESGRPTICRNIDDEDEKVENGTGRTLASVVATKFSKPNVVPKIDVIVVPIERRVDFASST